MNDMKFTNAEDYVSGSHANAELSETNSYDDNEEPSTLLSGHTCEELGSIINFLEKNKNMRIELIDAFLTEYQITSNVQGSINFASHELDV